MDQINIRPLLRRDLQAVLDIDFESFMDAWGEDRFVQTMCERGVIGMVAEIGDRVVGYSVRRNGTATIELMRLAVDPAFWRRGVGTALIEQLVNRLSPRRFRYIVLDVPERHLGAQLFLQRLGFRAEFYLDNADGGDGWYAMNLDIERLEAVRAVEWARSGGVV